MHVQIHRYKTAWTGLALVTALVLTGCGSSSTADSTEPSGNSVTQSSKSSKVSTSATPSATSNSVTPSASSSASEMTWEKYKFANDNFQIDLPSNWKIKKIKAEQYQSVADMTESFNIVSENGRNLAEVRTGYPAVFDITVRPTSEENTLIDSTPDPAGKMVNYAFISYKGSPNEAWLTLTAIDPETASNWQPPLDGPVFEGGTGLFQSQIDEKTNLPGVDQKLKGIDRFKAYSKTEEYKNLKKTMLSFKQLKAAQAEQQSNDGSCIGAQYTYDLGDSGMSCDEAKAFFAQILKQPISTGAAELPGVGACMMPYDTEPGFCNINASDGQFTVSEK